MVGFRGASKIFICLILKIGSPENLIVRGIEWRKDHFCEMPMDQEEGEEPKK